MRQTILVAIGTRPEAIKLFPLVHLLNQNSHAKTIVCVTGQHREMLDQVLAFSRIEPDYDLNIMKVGQSLDELSAAVLSGVGRVLDAVKPNRVIVQGDTTTAAMSALSAFYRRIPIAHVEAGLRTNSKFAPWPEEINRRIISQLADQHFAPTNRARDALANEGIPMRDIFVTGNTVVDALKWAQRRLREERQDSGNGSGPRKEKRRILVTCHRRENFGCGVSEVVSALLEIADRQDVHVFVQVHPNPNVRSIFESSLGKHHNISLLSPLSYAEFVALLDQVDFILTDSGGIQEEAPALGKPVLVLRETTERPEAIEAGTALLVGTNRARIVRETFKLLDDADHYRAMATAHNPFGDGFASERIVGVLLNGR